MGMTDSADTPRAGHKPVLSAAAAHLAEDRARVMSDVRIALGHRQGGKGRIVTVARSVRRAMLIREGKDAASVMPGPEDGLPRASATGRKRRAGRAKKAAV